MNAVRYIKASERAVRVLEGAFLWAKVQDTVPQSPESNAAVAEWERWATGRSQAEIDGSRMLQRQAFDHALSWPAA